MPKVGYKHTPEHNERISAGLRKAAATPAGETNGRKKYAGWECPEGFEEFYEDLVAKLKNKDEARKLIEAEAARVARRSA